MKATEARKISIEPQFEAAMYDIKSQLHHGRTEAHINQMNIIYPEVAERIANKGYDINVIFDSEHFFSISCARKHIGPESKGIIKYSDRRKPVDNKLPKSLKLEKEETYDDFMRFQDAKKVIEQAAKAGKGFENIWRTSTLPYNVVKMLAAEGYDVIIVLRPNDYWTENIASWEHAAEGRKGKVVYINYSRGRVM